MTRGAVKGWYLVHKWSSLVCTIFLLMLCVTGLPLIFSEEIADFAVGPPTVTAPAAGARPANLDTLIEAAKAQYPGNRPLFLGWYADERIVYVNLGPTADTPPAAMKTALFDAYSGKHVPAPQFNAGILYVILQLHTDMLAGLPGKLFLGAMGVLFVVAIVSGVVLYRPFMRKVAFATVRRQRSTRLKWLDLHNLFGIVIAAWLLVVGLTGIINTLEQPLYDRWQKGELARLTVPWANKPVPTRFASIERAVAVAKAARPALRPAFVSYPGVGYSGGHHYGVFMVGASELDQRNYRPVLVDAATARLTGVPEWPLALSAMYLSQPLHYGDYGGLPLKLVWAALDLLAIIVLGSGIYLWIGHRGTSLERRVKELVEHGNVA